ncbi:MAG: hypothetical protein N2260_02400 [Syntrophobacterales bacterium]|nr:hypothetical protein [Syntrophobacterales bacterium]
MKKLFALSLFVFTLLPLDLYAEDRDRGDIIIYRSGPSEEEIELNRLRSLAREEHAWEMLKSMGIKFILPKEPLSYDKKLK